MQSPLIQENLNASSDEELNQIFNSIDTNSNGTIEYSEFITAAMDRSIQLSRQNLEDAFINLADDEGQLTTRQLMDFFTVTEADQSTEDSENNPIWQQMANEFDTNNDGLITKEEFFAGMRKIAHDELEKQANDAQTAEGHNEFGDQQ